MRQPIMALSTARVPSVFAMLSVKPARLGRGVIRIVVSTGFDPGFVRDAFAAFRRCNSSKSADGSCNSFSSLSASLPWTDKTATAIFCGHSSEAHAEMASGRARPSPSERSRGRENQSLVSATPITGLPAGVQLVSARKTDKTKASLGKDLSLETHVAARDRVKRRKNEKAFRPGFLIEPVADRR